MYGIVLWNRMTWLRSSRGFTYLLAVSVALIIGGVFAVRGSATLAACIHTNTLDQIASLLGRDFRVMSVGINEIVYYDGCNHASLSTVSLLPEVLGVLSFSALVSYPAVKPLSEATNRLDSILVVLGSLGLFLVYFANYIPGYALLLLLGFVAAMRSRW